ncbi:hypothetical protein AGMMS49949_08360 [Alphaproteobacteria bacterium]|nr:hypothetical protein AGMMS49949_08360 [Alphaproteobacteria bacterium]GHS99480.1 hypothetical protein AGMMS50296_7640 [Alphaproteobacteria bacterium]
MTQPLMPKATAIWLIENTKLTFEQIAAFCELHILEIESIANEEGIQMVGFDPIASSQLTFEEIRRCEADTTAQLRLSPTLDVDRMINTNRSKYTPVVKRKDKPSAILWLVKYHPELSDAQIGKFLGTTRLTVQSLRLKTHWNYANIEAHSPVALGLCTQGELDALLQKKEG